MLLAFDLSMNFSCDQLGPGYESCRADSARRLVDNLNCQLQACIGHVCLGRVARAGFTEPSTSEINLRLVSHLTVAST
ncbi:hypothetical protein J6590_069429 [Homalodisca vitripennis]|nr:hypothetical protein J6590_069429 [Homalodisca vitripennis]